MSVPLDNLYHWIESLLPAPAVMYLFYPHGSKKLSDFESFKDYSLHLYHTAHGIILHDQEPLNWELYDNPKEHIASCKKFFTGRVDNYLQKTKIKYCSNFNLKSFVLFNNSGLYDQTILVHSEKNSNDLRKYQQNNFLCVHYWAHAVIARDWYRFAEHDTRLVCTSDPHNKFLVYCRDWSSQREYRLKFLELLAQNNLLDDSKISTMHINSENVHFSQYKFNNPALALNKLALIETIPNNTYPSTASADYESSDFTNSQISVILETVFDGNRIHLTEKTLRPIACNHPFILAAGPGSLEYIRSYGFKTFAPWIDESYDLETDSVKRLEKIILAMKKIQNLQGHELLTFSQNVKKIAEFNKKHFFSDEFFHTVRSELKNNLMQAYKLVKNTRGKHYLKILELAKKYNLTHQVQNRRAKTLLLRQLRQSYRLDQSNPAADSPV
jgi:hypothetical protein